MKEANISTPISLRSIQITDAFWKRELELVRKEVIPYQWEALNDRVEGAAPSYCMRNFKIAGEITRKRKELGEGYQEIKYPTDVFVPLPEDKNHMEERFYGFVFQDSDFYKWIEAVGYSLTQHPDEELERLADEAIDLVCAAQQPNGYLNTYYIINNMDHIFTSLQHYHELYCFGHLVEGAVAYYEATGKDALLKASERYADYIDRLFGEEEGKCKGYPGHEIAEMALVRLYQVTQKERYLSLSKFFIEERGKRPYYFDKEQTKPISKEQEHELRYQYNQAHLPVREQTEAVGHAVRGVYLYSGMADIARLTRDETMLQACEVLWNSIVNEKMYITGGIGGTHIGEAFSFPYDLPNDTAYAETCASIGLVFFARRMLELKADSKYADVMERALYNGILSGMALDGKSFFYVNPLEVLPEACHRDERKKHVKPIRQKWFGCACCPPNIARLISSIGAYGFTETKDTLYVHLYMGAEIKKEISGSLVNIQITSSLPWEGSVSVRVTTEVATEFTLALRIPEWGKDYHISIPEGIPKGIVEVKDGYYYITRCWSNNDTITLNFPMKIRRIRSNPRVRENIGRIAITRGPIVYCLEERDNQNNLHLISVPRETNFTTKSLIIQDREVIALVGKGTRILQEALADMELYSDAGIDLTEETSLTWIPYYTWANRGEGEMQVWVRG